MYNCRYDGLFKVNDTHHETGFGFRRRGLGFGRREAKGLGFGLAELGVKIRVFPNAVICLGLIA